MRKGNRKKNVLSGSTTRDQQKDDKSLLIILGQANMAHGNKESFLCDRFTVRHWLTI
jgi:hypothetical protein